MRTAEAAAAGSQRLADRCELRARWFLMTVEKHTPECECAGKGKPVPPAETSVTEPSRHGGRKPLKMQGVFFENVKWRCFCC